MRSGIFDVHSAMLPSDLQEETEKICAAMETAEELDALLEQYQTLLDEGESMDADN